MSVSRKSKSSASEPALLAVDIGNTTIHLGVFVGERLVGSWRLSSPVPRTPDECWATVSQMLAELGLRPKDLSAAGIASVVPDHTAAFYEMVSHRLKSPPLVITAANCSFLKIRYRDPRQVGADRICNAVAGYRFYGGPLVVVDFGTAVTLDVVDDVGAYWGGVVLPGPESAAALLHARTAQLPRVAPEFPDRIVGDSTEAAIRAGLTWGWVDMVDGLIERIASESGAGRALKTVSTGGGVAPYAARSRLFPRVHPNLTLEGIRIIHQMFGGSVS